MRNPWWNQSLSWTRVCMGSSGRRWVGRREKVGGGYTLGRGNSERVGGEKLLSSALAFLQSCFETDLCYLPLHSKTSGSILDHQGWYPLGVLSNNCTNCMILSVFRCPPYSCCTPGASKFPQIVSFSSKINQLVSVMCKPWPLVEISLEEKKGLGGN